LPLVLGLLLVSCPAEEDEEKEEKPVTGPLYGIEFVDVQTINTKYDRDQLEKDTEAEKEGIGFFGDDWTEDELTSTGNFAVKIDDTWYISKRSPKANSQPQAGGTGFYYYYFGTKDNLGKWYEKRELRWVSASYGTGMIKQTTQQVEVKPFEYVDKDQIKIDDQVYKYELGESKKRKFFINNIPTNNTQDVITCTFRILKIFYDGIDNEPTLYMYVTAW
jgi:hypothetical protein